MPASSRTAYAATSCRSATWHRRGFARGGERCGDEKRSAETAVRTPLSKQRNKHIQRVLVEAAKLAPRYDPDLALFYAREKQSGNANRATHRGCRGGCSPSPSAIANNRRHSSRFFGNRLSSMREQCGERRRTIHRPRTWTKGSGALTA